MRISLTNGLTTYLLAGDVGLSEREFASAVDFRIGARVNRQPRALLRAATAYDVDRQNLATTIGFSTRRVFTTPLDAFEYATGYDANSARSGTLILDTVSPTGTVVSRQLQDAVVSPPTRRVEGCTVYLAFTVRGGGIVPGGVGTTRVLDEDGGLELEEDGGETLTEE